MICWSDIACIVFVCVTINHLGLVKAAEDVIKREIPIINCPKCASFWVTLFYCCCNTATSWTIILALSLISSYMAIWLELFEGYIDFIYNKIYEQIYSTADTSCSDSEHS